MGHRQPSSLRWWVSSFLASAALTSFRIVLLLLVGIACFVVVLAGVFGLAWWIFV